MTSSFDWIPLVRRLASIADAGLFYTKDAYDKERYRELQGITARLLAAGMDLPLDGVLRSMENNIGYLTPKIDVRGVIFQDEKALLVRERSDGRWALPGGWGDVGESPSQTVTKEVREEAGLIVRATKLIGVFDGETREPAAAYHAHKLFFRCEVEGEAAGEEFLETDGKDLFSLDALPPLSEARTSKRELEECFRHLADPGRPPHFD